MDELKMEVKVRAFIKEAGIDRIPVNLRKYTDRLSIDVKLVHDLDDEVAARMFPIGQRRKVLVNARHTREKQRFTIAHEVAHVLLELSLSHEKRYLLKNTLNRFTGKSKEETICDLCAAELLLPEAFVERDVKCADLGFGEIRKLASRYYASLTATAFRYAQFNPFPCAVVLSEERIIRYVKASESFKAVRSFIQIGQRLSPQTYAADLFAGRDIPHGPQTISTDTWLDSYGGKQEYLFEESVLISEFNQVLSLLWHEDEEEDEEDDIEELDGHLRFRPRR
ncbi:MAG: ImmA/IrrE family metallo-endopeptidase [Candidatus Binatia bacterium]